MDFADVTCTIDQHALRARYVVLSIISPRFPYWRAGAGARGWGAPKIGWLELDAACVELSLDVPDSPTGALALACGLGGLASFDPSGAGGEKLLWGRWSRRRSARLRPWHWLELDAAVGQFRLDLADLACGAGFDAGRLRGSPVCMSVARASSSSSGATGAEGVGGRQDRLARTRCRVRRAFARCSGFASGALALASVSAALRASIQAARAAKSCSGVDGAADDPRDCDRGTGSNSTPRSVSSASILRIWRVALALTPAVCADRQVCMSAARASSSSSGAAGAEGVGGRPRSAGSNSMPRA